jgi:hypothetical protein
MMARNTNVPFKGRIQKPKTHYLQIITFGLQRAAGPSRRAMCERLRVGKDFLHACSIGRSSHVFGLFARFTRPAIMPSADQVPVLVGCPDRRIDRQRIKCCSSSPTVTSRRVSGAISFTP